MNVRRQRLRRLRKLILWTTAVVVASLAGGLWFAYIYVTDSETIAGLVRANSPKFLKHGWVDLTRAQLKPLTGEVVLRQVRVMQRLDGVPFAVVRVPRLQVKSNPRALLQGRFELNQVNAAQLNLRLRRRKDGTWNVCGLLAGQPHMDLPPIHVENGTVELSDDPDPAAPPVTVLRNVTLEITPAGKGKLTFEGDARGDMLEKVDLSGSIDLTTGRVEFRGEVDRLIIAETLRERVPREVRDGLDRLGLTGGEVDLTAQGVVIDPGATPAVRYDVSGKLRGGAWNCPKLPFPLNDVLARFAVKDGVVTVEHAAGIYGTTIVRVDRARFDTSDPKHEAFDLKMQVTDLKLDKALREWTPSQFAPLWTQYRPSGRVTAAFEASRDRRGAPFRHKLTVDCLDVAMLYEHFKYPLDHISGRFVWDGERVDILGMETLVGGQPLTTKGVILHPGPRAVVQLAFVSQGMPIDKTLLEALPQDVLKVVKEFNPTGTVKCIASLHRTPPEKPGDDPRGKVAIDATLDLHERCGIKWVGLPYPINNLTGRLEVHPDLWVLKDMKGFNGQAEIHGGGQVEKLPDGRLKVDLNLKADKLPFDDQLRAALPPAWRKSWAVLSPTGSSDVDAKIRVEPGRPDAYRLVVVPGPSTGIRLQYTREPKPGDPGGKFSLRMEDVTGRFVFNNGPVDMTDVTFRFHGAPVQFGSGRVIVQNDGRFDIGVRDLWVKDIRLDPGLQAIMPPVMAQFAQRLDDGRAFTLKGNMGLGWSGKPGSSVLCTWDHAKVVFVTNSVRTTSGVTLKNIQGELKDVRGRADGESFEVHGALALDSVSVFGQQVTKLESKLDVDRGFAHLEDLRGNLLGGEIAGRVGLSLDATPRYETSIAVRGADLHQYAGTLPGHQTFRGKVDARLDLKGFGADLRTLQGGGEGHLVDGDLGTLPVYLQVFKLLTLAPATKTAFDSADVAFKVEDGKTRFEPIRFTGDAFSLHGRGVMDLQGDLDLRLRVLYGRDRVKIWFLNDALREASGQIMVLRVHGTPSSPKVRVEALPTATEAVKSALGQRKERRNERLGR